jgi:hypothetical protein
VFPDGNFSPVPNFLSSFVNFYQVEVTNQYSCKLIYKIHLCNKGDPILFFVYILKLLVLFCVDWLESISWRGRLTQVCTVVPKQTRGKETWFFPTKETQKFAVSALVSFPPDATADRHSRQLIVLIVCNVEMISIWLVFSCSCESSNFYTPVDRAPGEHFAPVLDNRMKNINSNWESATANSLDLR